MKPMYAFITLSLLGIATLHFLERRHYHAEMDQVRSKLTSLSTSLDETRKGATLDDQRRGPVAPLPLLPAGQDGASTQTSPGSSAEAAPIPDPIKPIEVREQLELRFVEERSDPEWTTSAQQTAQDRLRVILPKTSLLHSLECRASMCRFETMHENLPAYQQFVQDAFLNPETKIWNGGFFTTELTDPVDGKLMIVSYLARDGADLEPVQFLQ